MMIIVHKFYGNSILNSKVLSLSKYNFDFVSLLVASKTKMRLTWVPFFYAHFITASSLTAGENLFVAYP